MVTHVANHVSGRLYRCDCFPGFRVGAAVRYGGRTLKEFKHIKGGRFFRGKVWKLAHGMGKDQSP